MEIYCSILYIMTGVYINDRNNDLQSKPGKTNDIWKSSFPMREKTHVQEIGPMDQGKENLSDLVMKSPSSSHLAVGHGTAEQNNKTKHTRTLQGVPNGSL